jgi:hypothetical protein
MVTGTMLEVLPVQSFWREKTIGPFTVAGDCRGAGRENVAGNEVRFVTQVEQVPEGRRDVSVNEGAR